LGCFGGTIEQECVGEVRKILFVKMIISIALDAYSLLNLWIWFFTHPQIYLDYINNKFW
jgi:hypothetical protein